MRIKHVWIVFKKEVKDIARDKKTLITSILAPIIIMPVLALLLGGGAEKFQKELTENITIGLTSQSNTPEIRDVVQNGIISQNNALRLVDIEDPVTAIREEKVQVVLEFEQGYKEKLSLHKPFEIKLMYDNSKSKSDSAMSVVSEAIGKYNMKLVEERLTSLGQSPEILQPSIIEQENVADEKKSGNMMLMMMVPMLLALLVAVGGIPAATDLVAGEKERNTFEPLLTTKPDRMSILFGKYLTVTLFSFVSVLATLAGFAIGFIANPSFAGVGAGTETGGFYVPPVALMLALLICILLGMTFAGIQIAMSTYAKSFKEAQTYLSLLIFVAMIPGYATMFMQPNDIQFYMYLTPILNTISAFKMVLGGSINYLYLIIALVSSMAYVGISLWLAAWMFTKEKVLFRS